MYRNSDDQLEGFDQVTVDDAISDVVLYGLPHAAVLYRIQKQIFGIPIDLQGTGAVQRAREQNIGYFITH